MIDWTSPGSYATAPSVLDRLVADAAGRHLHEAFVEVSSLLERIRDADEVDDLQVGIERSFEAMVAYVNVDDELRRMRRSPRPVRILEALETVCEAHHGLPGLDDGVRYEAAPTAIVGLADPAAAWAAAAALAEMIRELSKRGAVRVEAVVGSRSLSILATAPAVRVPPALRRSTPTAPFLRQLVTLLSGQYTRRVIGRRIMLRLVIPLAPKAALQ